MTRSRSSASGSSSSSSSSSPNDFQSGYSNALHLSGLGKKPMSSRVYSGDAIIADYTTGDKQKGLLRHDREEYHLGSRMEWHNLQPKCHQPLSPLSSLSVSSISSQSSATSRSSTPDSDPATVRFSWWLMSTLKNIYSPNQAKAVHDELVCISLHPNQYEQDIVRALLPYGLDIVALEYRRTGEMTPDLRKALKKASASMKA
ncbi:hypothetical protein EIP91_002787 [Steccherinum ochraceum]|uniref:Uncharacterized protein n=1 Tax=Steccherinum ochraceum TaxID=92696 RepID=A0A4R0RNB5_9APHY|nr:hypothetical protein EIP91_002787 [Steccherinum ochraceum]